MKESFVPVAQKLSKAINQWVQWILIKLKDTLVRDRLPILLPLHLVPFRSTVMSVVPIFFIHLSTKTQFEVYCKRLSCSCNPPFFSMNANLSSPYFPNNLTSCVFSVLPHLPPLMSHRLCVKSVNAAVALWQRSELQCRNSGNRTLCFVSSSVTLWPS